MTPSELKEARLRLGLTLDQMATMLGYSGAQRRQMMHKLETEPGGSPENYRTLRPVHARLVRAYLAGYRPPDWPLK